MTDAEIEGMVAALWEAGRKYGVAQAQSMTLIDSTPAARSALLAALAAPRGDPDETATTTVPITMTVGVMLSLEQHNALLRVGDAVEAIPWCDDPECHSNAHGKTCHVHRLAAANAADEYVRRVLSGAAPRGEARDALAPWYEADGSTVMLPAEEVEQRRKLAAKALGAAWGAIDAWEDGGVFPGKTAMLNAVTALVAALSAIGGGCGKRIRIPYTNLVIRCGAGGLCHDCAPASRAPSGTPDPSNERK